MKKFSAMFVVSVLAAACSIPLYSQTNDLQETNRKIEEQGRELRKTQKAVGALKDAQATANQNIRATRQQQDTDRGQVASGLSHVDGKLDKIDRGEKDRSDQLEKTLRYVGITTGALMILGFSILFWKLHRKRNVNIVIAMQPPAIAEPGALSETAITALAEKNLVVVSLEPIEHATPGKVLDFFEKNPERDSVHVFVDFKEVTKPVMGVSHRPSVGDPLLTFDEIHPDSKKDPPLPWHVAKKRAIVRFGLSPFDASSNKRDKVTLGENAIN